MELLARVRSHATPAVLPPILFPSYHFLWKKKKCKVFRELRVITSALRPSHPSCFCPPLSPPSELVQGAAMSTAAVMPFRSFVQTPIFSVSPSSFSLQRI